MVHVAPEHAEAVHLVVVKEDVVVADLDLVHRQLGGHLDELQAPPEALDPQLAVLVGTRRVNSPVAVQHNGEQVPALDVLNFVFKLKEFRVLQ